jgi:hypothetical protein
MSYDPYAYGADVPPDEAGITRPAGEVNYASQRVKIPAIGLLVTGLLNLLGAGWIFLNVGLATMRPANEITQQAKDMYQSFPEMQAELAKKSPEELKAQFMLIGWGWVAAGLLGALLPIAGGIRMLSLKNYSLSICGAIAAAIPCVSCTGCCGIGQITGIWALVVLLNEEVKAAFR